MRLSLSRSLSMRLLFSFSLYATTLSQCMKGFLCLLPSFARRSFFLSFSLNVAAGYDRHHHPTAASSTAAKSSREREREEAFSFHELHFVFFTDAFHIQIQYTFQIALWLLIVLVERRDEEKSGSFFFSVCSIGSFDTITLYWKNPPLWIHHGSNWSMERTGCKQVAFLLNLNAHIMLRRVVGQTTFIDRRVRERRGFCTRFRFNIHKTIDRNLISSFDGFLLNSHVGFSIDVFNWDVGLKRHSEDFCGQQCVHDFSIVLASMATCRKRCSRRSDMQMRTR